MKTDYSFAQYAEIYLTRIVCLRRVPKTIVSDRRPQFIANFWKALHPAMGMSLIFSTAYYSQTSGQTKRVNQIQEDMLRACAIMYSESWDICLPFAEFAYNNSYQANINGSSYEALYEQNCRTPINWSEVGKRSLFRSDMVKDSKEKVDQIRKCLVVAQECYKS